MRNIRGKFIRQNLIHAIHRASDGTLWFGTEGGVSCYDGSEFHNFTVKDGLAHYIANAINCDAEPTVCIVSVQTDEEYTDLTESHKQLEVTKEAAEAANQAKSTFLSTMSHEIRTPLNAVIGYAQVLQRDQELKQRQRETVSAIENSGKHLLELINGILDLAKIESERMELP